MFLALDLLHDATGARTTWPPGIEWPEDPSWKLDRCNIDRLSAEELARRRAEYAAIREQARPIREEE